VAEARTSVAAGSDAPARASADFERTLEQHRRELTGYCYRMLGSSFEAEDAVQETLLRAWRAIDRFEARSALKSWLYRIATNVCLDMLSGRKRRARPIDLGPSGTIESQLATLPEATWIEPIPDGRVLPEHGDPAELAEARETLRLAFVAALQHLPASQRAVLILREVLRWKAAEVAELLDTSVASVNSALQRARRAIDERRPERSQQATLRELGDERLRALVERYMDAMQRGDVDAVIALLAQDAAWSMPPMATWYRGHDALRVFLANGPLSGQWQWRYVPARTNGQAAIGAYTWRAEEQSYRPFALDVLTVSGEQLQAVTSFIARSANGLSGDELARFPTQPPDEAKVESIFVRCGLPSRLD